jgi:hypothetical protein
MIMKEIFIFSLYKEIININIKTMYTMFNNKVEKMKMIIIKNMIDCKYP